MVFKHTTYDKEKGRIYGEKSVFYHFSSEFLLEIVRHLYGETANINNIPAVQLDCERNYTTERCGVRISFKNTYGGQYHRDRKYTEKSLGVPPKIVWQTAKGGYVNGKKIKEIVTDIQEKTADYIKTQKDEVDKIKKLTDLRDSLIKDMALLPTDSLYMTGTADHPVITLNMRFDNIVAPKEMYKLGRHILSL